MLPTMGGQTALNTALALFRDGTLEKFGVQMIGADAEAIDKAEDRLKFKDAMTKIGLESARSAIAHTVEEALAGLEVTGLPAIIRPSFTMGGSGGGVVLQPLGIRRDGKEGPRRFTDHRGADRGVAARVEGV